MWNGPISGTVLPSPERPTTYSLLRSGVVERIIRERLPTDWDVTLEPAARPTGPDAVLRIAGPDGAVTRILVEVKPGIQPQLAASVADQLNQYGDGPKLLIAPFLSPRAQDALTNRGVGFLDMTGNIYLTADRPALFIRERGLLSDPWREERSIRSLKGPTAGRVVRALCDFRPPYGIRELAARSDTAPSSVSRVLSFLEPEGLVVRDRRGPVTAVDWPDLIRRWTQDYSFITSNTTYSYLEPRGVNALLGRLVALPGEQTYSVTGSAAANRIEPFAPARLITIYADDAVGLGETLGLRPTDSSGNVLLAEPFDSVVFDRTWEQDGVRYAGLSQVAADLLTSPGRAPSEGEALIRWMQENGDAWRR